ncbi:MAG: hypothetical protein QW041_02915 [Candidatus Pacearchaeota archaeon]
MEKYIAIQKQMCIWRHILIYKGGSTAEGMRKSIDRGYNIKDCHKCFGYDSKCSAYCSLKKNSIKE